MTTSDAAVNTVLTTLATTPANTSLLTDQLSGLKDCQLELVLANCTSLWADKNDNPYYSTLDTYIHSFASEIYTARATKKQIIALNCCNMYVRSDSIYRIRIHLFIQDSTIPMTQVLGIQLFDDSLFSVEQLNSLISCASEAQHKKIMCKNKNN